MHSSFLFQFVGHWSLVLVTPVSPDPDTIIELESGLDIAGISAISANCDCVGYWIVSANLVGRCTSGTDSQMSVSVREFSVSNVFNF